MTPATSRGSTSAKSRPTIRSWAAPKGSNPIEIDRPQSANAETDTRNTFDGKGGPSIGNWFNRLVYALKFQSTDLHALGRGQLRVADPLRPQSPRTGREGGPVPDAWTATPIRRSWTAGSSGSWTRYTTSTATRTRTPQQLESATIGLAAPGEGGPVAPAGRGVNYIRNSVKATVDAYDGSVDAVRLGRPAIRCSRPGRRSSRPRSSRWRDVAGPDGPRALPGGPVQGPARAARPATT